MGSGTGFNECVVLPEIYFVNLDDSYGDGWDLGSLSIGDVSYSTDGYSVISKTEIVQMLSIQQVLMW